MTEFTDKINPSGTILLEPGYPAAKWPSMWFASNHLIDIQLKALSGGSRLKSGSFDGATLTEVEVVYRLANGTTETKTFDDRAVAIVDKFQIWYANRSTGAIAAVDLVSYDQLSEDADLFPLLFTGFNQATGSTRQSFWRWIWVKETSTSVNLDTRISQNDVEHVLGTAAQVTNYQATVKQVGGVLQDRSGNQVNLVAGDKVRIIGMDVLTADLTFAVRVRLEGDPGVALNTAGFKVTFAGDKSTAKGLYFTNVAIAGLEVTGNDIVDFSIFADATGRLVDSVLGYTARLKNLGERNRLGLNGQMAYDYSRTSSIIWCAGDYLPAYSLPSGGSYDPALFKDLAHVNTEAEPWGLGPIHGLDVGNYKLPPYPGRFLRVHDNNNGVDPDRDSRGDRGDGTTGDAVGTSQSDGAPEISGSFNSSIHATDTVTLLSGHAGVFSQSGASARAGALLSGSGTLAGTTYFAASASNTKYGSKTGITPTNIYIGLCHPV